MNQHIGDARVSADGQHLVLQSDGLTKAGCGVIYKDKSTICSKLEQCMMALGFGGTLVVWWLAQYGLSCVCGPFGISAERETERVLNPALSIRVHDEGPVGGN